MTAQLKVDSHVHVWDPNFPTHPSHPLPPISATADDLISQMDAAGIDKTLIVQPINYKFDHTCILDAVKRFPNRFYPIALADTSLPAEKACAILEDQVKSGFCGIRINPTFTPDGFANPTVAALIETAANLDIPVALFARPEHLPDVTALLKSFPKTKLILDHFAFCTPTEHEAAQQQVLQLGRQYPNLYIKASAWFRVSKNPFPHNDIHPYLSNLISTFGTERILIGSDYPFVKEQYTYTQALSLLDHTSISPDDRAWIQGKSAAKLYKLP